MSNIRNAQTIDKSLYVDTQILDTLKATVFENAWHYLASSNQLEQNNLIPVKILPSFIGENVLLSKSKSGEIKCLSNVCTHRGNLLVSEPCNKSKIVCKYHGRRFDTQGNFEFMPEFEGVENFPCPNDNLQDLNLEKFGSLLFVNLQNKTNFNEIFNPIKSRLSWLDWNEMKYYPQYSTTYKLNANWALYVDNYLEGFHIPFVHPDLNQLLDYSSYSSEIFDFCNLQLGIAKESEMHFELPTSAPDYGKKIAAYYFWVYPNLMFNFYPWGLSLNVVRPVSLEKTEIDFFTFIGDVEKYQIRDHNALNLTEMEDEAIVLSVQEGVKSRFYKSGKYSPKMEQGVYHFHQLLRKDLGL